MPKAMERQKKLELLSAGNSFGVRAALKASIVGTRIGSARIGSARIASGERSGKQDGTERRGEERNGVGVRSVRDFDGRRLAVALESAE